jgi:exosortase A
MTKYQHWASLSIFFVGSIFVFLPTWSSLIDRWSESEGSYSHGYLILIISCYFIIKQLRLIDYTRVKANYFVFPFLMGSSLIWALAVSANIEVIHQVLLPIILSFIIIMVLGLDKGKKFLFPCLYLLLAVPFWDYLIVPLQIITVFINSFLLDLAGITVYIDGFFVTISSGSFEVAGGCSGLRYVMVSLALSLLYAYQNYSRWRTTAALLLTAISFALLANWIRVFIIIVVGEVTEMQSSLIKSHDMFGWVLFAITLIPFFYLAMRYVDWFEDEPVVIKKAENHHLGAYKPLPYVVAFLITFSFPLFISANTSLDVLPSVGPVFAGNRVQPATLSINPIFIGADSKQDEVFAIDGGLLQVSLRTYDAQKPGKELVFYKNKLFSNNWLVSQQTRIAEFSLYHLEHPNSGQKLMVASRYFIGGYQVNNKNIAKLLELFKPLMSLNTSSILILASPCDESCELAQSRIETFLSKNVEAVGNL